jgi:hypothetical protein
MTTTTTIQRSINILIDLCTFTTTRKTFSISTAAVIVADAGATINTYDNNYYLLLLPLLLLLISMKIIMRISKKIFTDIRRLRQEYITMKNNIGVIEYCRILDRQSTQI